MAVKVGQQNYTQQNYNTAVNSVKFKPNQFGMVLAWVWMVGIAYVMVLNMKPWITFFNQLGEFVAPNVMHFENIPLGYAVYALLYYGDVLIGVAFWAAIQMTQIAGDVVSMTNTKMNPYIRVFRNFRGWAYVFEAFICYLVHPFFGTPDAILAGNIEFGWWTVAKFIITLFGFECMVKAGISVCAMMGVNLFTRKAI